MYRYALLLLLFIITSCNAGRLTYVRQDRTIVSEEEIATVDTRSTEQQADNKSSIRLSENQETPVELEETATTDVITDYQEPLNDNISVDAFPISEDDTLYLGNDEVPSDYKVEQALRSQRFAGISLLTSIFSILSLPLAVLVAIITWSGVGAGIVLGLGALLLIISWITLFASASNRFSTEKAGRLRTIAVVLLVIVSLIAVLMLLAIFI